MSAQPTRRIVVTIDGPAGAGKSTVARRLARRLGYRLLDTGAIYRAVALASRRGGVPWTAGPALGDLARELDIRFDFVDDRNHVYVAGEDVTDAIRTPEISQGASQVSAHPEVRAALLELQRRLGAGGGVVVEGRDTGTVVFPAADAKFFLTASVEERARRRTAELAQAAGSGSGAGSGIRAAPGAAAGAAIDLEATLREIRERDQRDASRDVAPMVPAHDALVVDSSAQTLEEVVDFLAVRVHERAAG